MEFSCRLISDGCDRGSSFFFQPHRPIATEQVALELELFDGRRKRGLDWHDLDSADTILNIRARTKNRSRTRNFRNSKDVIARISSAAPIFSSSTNVQDCVRRIEIVPVETTLAPTIEQLQFQGDQIGRASSS